MRTGMAVRGPVGPPGASASVYPYKLNPTTTPPPGAGQLRTNGSGPTVTEAYLSYVTDDNNSVGPLLRTIKTGDKFTAQEATDDTKWVRFTVTGTPTDVPASSYITIPVTYDAGPGTTGKNNQRILVFHTATGATGPQGPAGPGMALPYISGMYIDQRPVAVTPTSAAPGAGTIFYVMQYIYTPVTFVSIGINVTALGTGSTVRLGLYQVNQAAFTPTTRIADYGTVDTSTTGAKEITVSQAIASAGWWAFAYLAAGTAPTVSVATSSSTPHNIGATTLNGTPRTGRQETGTSLPATASATTSTATMPLIYFKIA